MSANVVGLNGQPAAQQDRKRLFMSAVSDSFDLFTKDYGEEPEAIVYVLGGVQQTCRVAWQMTGRSEGAATSMKAFATMVLIKDTVNPD